MHPESFVFFDETDVVSWDKDRPAAFGDPGVVEVWRLHFPSFLDGISELYEILQPEEKRRSALFYHESDRQKFIIGKAMLRFLMADYLNLHPLALNFTRGMFMKPVLKIGDEIPFHFNVSHSGNYMLIAVSDTPVGIDVEHYDSGLNISEVMQIALSEKERNFTENETVPHQAFFKLWTRKEALLKATSKGLNNNIKIIPSLNGKHSVSPLLINNDENWRVSNFHVDEDHIGSVAYRHNNRELRFKQFSTQRQYAFC